MLPCHCTSLPSFRSFTRSSIFMTSDAFTWAALPRRRARMGRQGKEPWSRGLARAARWGQLPQRSARVVGRWGNGPMEAHESWVDGKSAAAGSVGRLAAVPSRSPRSPLPTTRCFPTSSMDSSAAASDNPLFPNQHSPPTSSISCRSKDGDAEVTWEGIGWSLAACSLCLTQGRRRDGHSTLVLVS